MSWIEYHRDSLKRSVDLHGPCRRKTNLLRSWSSFDVGFECCDTGDAAGTAWSQIRMPGRKMMYSLYSYVTHEQVIFFANLHLSTATNIQDAASLLHRCFPVEPLDYDIS